MPAYNDSKRCERKSPWSKLRHHLSISLEGLRKAMKNLGIIYPGKDFNWILPTYKLQALPLDLTCLLKLCLSQF